MESLNFPKWTPIAVLKLTEQTNHPQNRWQELDDAPILLSDARKLESQGHLLMAQRRRLGFWEVVVKSPVPKEPKVFRNGRMRAR